MSEKKHDPSRGNRTAFLFLTRIRFHSARYIRPARKRDDPLVVVAIQSDGKNSTENLAFLPHDALRMVEAVAGAIHQAGEPGAERVVRALAATGIGTAPMPPPGPVPAVLAGERSKSSSPNSKKPEATEEGTIIAAGKIFLSVGAATVAVPPFAPVIFVCLEGAQAAIEHTALNLHDAYLLAESLVATLAKSGIPEVRRLAKQLKERA